MHDRPFWLCPALLCLTNQITFSILPTRILAKSPLTRPSLLRSIRGWSLEGAGAVTAIKPTSRFARPTLCGIGVINWFGAQRQTKTATPEAVPGRTPPSQSCASAPNFDRQASLPSFLRIRSSREVSIQLTHENSSQEYRACGEPLLNLGYFY